MDKGATKNTIIVEDSLLISAGKMDHAESLNLLYWSGKQRETARAIFEPAEYWDVDIRRFIMTWWTNWSSAVTFREHQTTWLQVCVCVCLCVWLKPQPVGMKNDSNDTRVVPHVIEGHFPHWVIAPPPPLMSSFHLHLCYTSSAWLEH